MEEEIKTEEKEEKSEKKAHKFIAWFKEHPKATFWIRFGLFALLACILPFSFIVWRFKLFHTISSTQVGGWGIIAIVIVAVFIFVVLRYVKMALSVKYSFVAQCIGGFCKVVLPLMVVLTILYSTRNNVGLMIQVMGCVTVCEAIAIPLNPLPKWAYEAQKNVRAEERKETVDYLLDSFFSRKKKDESGE